MIQQTSLQAYFNNMPKLQANEVIVLDVIKQFPKGITNNEIAHVLNWSINRITGRTNSLYKKNIIYIKQKRNDLWTKNKSIVWCYPCIYPHTYTT